MTLIDLYAKTLEHLQITAAGDAAAPEDTAVVRDKYQSLYSALDGESLTDWARTEAIPTYAEQALVMLLAAYCATAFGITEPRYSQLQVEGGFGMPVPSMAERMLRRQLTRRYISSTQQTEYF